jgi:hypothetical protein
VLDVAEKGHGRNGSRRGAGVSLQSEVESRLVFGREARF